MHHQQTGKLRRAPAAILDVLESAGLAGYHICKQYIVFCMQYIYIYMYRMLCVSMYLYMFLFNCVYINNIIHVSLYIYMYIHIDICIYMYIDMYMYMYIYMWNVLSFEPPPRIPEHHALHLVIDMCSIYVYI